MVICDYILILRKMGKLYIGDARMTYNDKNFEFKPNIKEILAKNIRKYRIEKDIPKNNLQCIPIDHLNS